MFLLLFTTGIGLRELAILNLEDLNWEGNRVRILGKGSFELSPTLF